MLYDENKLRDKINYLVDIAVYCDNKERKGHLTWKDDNGDYYYDRYQDIMLKCFEDVIYIFLSNYLDDDICLLMYDKNLMEKCSEWCEVFNENYDYRFYSYEQQILELFIKDTINMQYAEDKIIFKSLYYDEETLIIELK